MIKKIKKFLENDIGFKKQIGWNFRKYKNQSKTCDTGLDKKVPLGVAKGYSINLSRTANVRTYSKEIVSKASFNARLFFQPH